MKDWVDFKEVKDRVTMQMLLDHYQINWLRKSGEELRGRCPIHEGEGQRTFHVNLSKNAFYCFSCKAKGNVLDFTAAMEDVSVRDAALKLAEWFGLGQAESRGGDTPEIPPRRQQRSQGATSKKAETVEEPEEAALIINPPLGFELRVDPEHEYGRSRGFSKELLEQFGVGYCLSKGMFSGRFVFPLHDVQGELVGYAGRSIDDSEPKYLFPSGEKSFHKRYLLWNFHREVKDMGPNAEVVVVEGFFDCLRVKEVGYPCVALLGSQLSREQEELLATHFQHVVLLLDGDEAGRAAADDCLRRLGRRVFIKAHELPEGEQPDTLSREDLVMLLMKGKQCNIQ